MAWTQTALDFDLEQAVHAISALLRSNFQRFNRKIAIIGLSGGLDSSLVATLAVQSLGKEHVQTYNLPEVDSKPVHRKHAQMLSNHLGIHLKTIKISSILRSLEVYKLLPLRFIPGRQLKTKAIE